MQQEETEEGEVVEPAGASGENGRSKKRPRTSPSSESALSLSSQTSIIYGPFVQFAAKWREIVNQVEWQVYLNDPKQVKKENQDVFLPVSSEGIRIYDEAASICLTIPRDCIIRLPFNVGLVLLYAGRKVQVLVQNIGGPHGINWTCPAGRIKLDVEPVPRPDATSPPTITPSATSAQTPVTQPLESPPPPLVCKLKRVRIQIHAETVLRELRIVPDPPSPSATTSAKKLEKDPALMKAYALVGYSLFVTLRYQDEPGLGNGNSTSSSRLSPMSPLASTPPTSYATSPPFTSSPPPSSSYSPLSFSFESNSSSSSSASSSASSPSTYPKGDGVLFRCRLTDMRVSRIESPYQNTVAFCLPKREVSPLAPQASAKDDDPTSAANGEVLPHIIPQLLLKPDDKDQLKLVADLLLYDQEDRVMWSKSAWLYPKRHALFSARWDACFLAEESFWACFSFEDRPKEGVTRLHDASFIIPLAKINTWSKTRYKLHDVAMHVIDYSNTTL